MSELDNDELIATRRLNGLEDNLFKEETMSEEAFNELIDNFEVVEHLTPYGRKGIKENVKKLQARIKELEEENKKYIVHLTDKQYRNLVDTIRKEVKQEFEQKIKDKLEELNKEYIKELEKNSTKAFILKCQITILEEILCGRKLTEDGRKLGD